MNEDTDTPRRDAPETSADVRMGRELVQATARFSEESSARSWWLVGSTFVLLGAAMSGAGLAAWWPLRLFFSILAALLLVRAFITFHDYMHGSILADSRVAGWLFRLFSVLILTPPRSWKKSHNYHHGHVGQITAVGIGGFPIMSTQMWRNATPAQRAYYRLERHPLTVLTGYLTIFAISLTLLPLLREPSRHWDSALVLIGHGSAIALLWSFFGFDAAFFVLLLPVTVASALGSYLFFAQHSFKRMHIISAEAWTYYRAALESSSYMQLNRVMQWFTGNIGYHHIHHLNVRIPFYRLPEAMAAIPELQSPVTTSLAPRDIIECFQACLWDDDRQRMVSFREAQA